MSGYPYIIGIAGGSGSGKTSIAIELHKKIPNSVLLHLDDFQKIDGQPENLHGFANWEHPSYVDWDSLLKVLKKLKNFKDITIIHRNQTNLKRSGKRTVNPKNLIIVEGYLLFFHPLVRKLVNTLVFLEASDIVRINRRTKFKNPDYVEHVLLPMHHKYVEPTRKYATLVINTEKSSIKEAVKLIQSALPISSRLN